MLSARSRPLIAALREGHSRFPDLCPSFGAVKADAAGLVPPPPLLQHSAAGVRYYRRYKWERYGWVKRNPNMLTGAALNALEKLRENAELQQLPDEEFFHSSPPPADALIVRSHNAPSISEGSKLHREQMYAAHPLNFTPLRPIQPGFTPLDRAVREVPWESRQDIMERRVEPWYASECRGTPRREYQEGMLGGIRIRQTQNPYVRLRNSTRYRLNTWPSRDWRKWSTKYCHVRGSRRRYRVPEDLFPQKDELGEWHPPRVSGRYRADIEKQFILNGLPWVWRSDFYESKLHYMDRRPKGPARWYRKQYRMAQAMEALRRADALVEDYRRERRDAKRLSWIETLVQEFAGEQLAKPFVRIRKRPKL
mmetsp:Transcript_9968/g.17926  ORF Transcript_9968/g.17926 Transcript_9968/m.17926 type:complete len:366 (-) Transcript_9968:45-1142(-)